MKPKQILILSIILGLLAAGVFLKTWARSFGDSADLSLSQGVPVAEFDPSKVDRILIGTAAQPIAVELSKENGGWKVKSLWDAKADPAKVAALLQKIHSARGELRGIGQDLFPDFGIQDAEAFSIKLLDRGGALLADLRLGKKQAGDEGFFLRRAGGAEVYFVALNLAELLGIYTDLDQATLSSAFWAELSLFSLDPEKVTKITITHVKGDTRTTVLGLSRPVDPEALAGRSWEFLREDMSSPVDPEKVLRFIATLSSIKAQKVVDPGGRDYGLEKPVWQVAVTEGDKKTLLSAGPKDEKGDQYYLRSSASSSVFSLKADSFGDLNVDDTDFVREVAPAAGAGEKS